jgi:DegV family protein with EDD domain
MGAVRVVADWGCDISPAEADRLGITLIPVFVSFGSETVSSDLLSSDDFWARVKRAGVPPTTAAPSPGAFQEAFRRLVNAGHDVVCLTLPSRHSSTFNSAWVGAQEFGDRVRVVDSGSLSLGMGLLVLRAAQDALAGHSAETIQRALENLRERTSVLFVLDTVEWARRGGRLERLLPLVDRAARTLNVKPIVELTNGEFRLVGIVRSTRGALQRIQDELRSRMPLEELAAAYTRGREAVGDLAGPLSAASGRAPEEIMVIEAGPVFAAHAGPGAIGAVFIRS